MDDLPAFSAAAIVIGVGATAFMDAVAFALKRLFGIPSLDYAMVGRWIGHMPDGRFAHDTIARADPIANERPLGWAAHYAIGIVFAGVLIAIVGVDWLLRPSLLPAILFSAATLAAPFFVMQPTLGFGMAAAKTPRPNIARLRSLTAHIAFGIGLYLTALAFAFAAGGP